MLLSPAAMCSCLEAFPNQRDHPNSPSELPYQFQSTCSSSPPALSSRSACREHSRCVNTSPALPAPRGHSPVYNHPLPAIQPSPAWFKVAPYPSSSACSHGQSCPSYNPVPCVCPARGCAVLPQHLIPHPFVPLQQQRHQGLTSPASSRNRTILSSSAGPGGESD